MDFEKKIKSLKEKIEKELLIFLSQNLKTEKFFNRNLNFFVDELKNFILRGGKRLRPILFITGYQAVNGENEEIIKASLSIELIEAFVLMHDDIIDRDEKRRGAPSFHILMGERLTDKHLGISAGIIGGDVLFNLGIKALIDSDFPADRKEKALKELLTAKEKCFFGELADIILQKKEEATEEEFFKMVELKTASYTVELPLVMGAILGDAEEEIITGFRKFGKELGKAFQIQDDILGTFGNPALTGKPADSDIKEGKKTLLLIYALQNATEEEKAFLRKTIGKGKVKEEDINKVREIYKRTGALSYCKEKAKEFAQKAKEILIDLKIKKEAKDFLCEFSDFIIRREL